MSKGYVIVTSGEDELTSSIVAYIKREYGQKLIDDTMGVELRSEIHEPQQLILRLKVRKPRADDPAHTTCIDVSAINQPRGTEWVCGPECPPPPVNLYETRHLDGSRS